MESIRDKYILCILSLFTYEDLTVGKEPDEREKRASIRSKRILLLDLSNSGRDPVCVRARLLFRAVAHEYRTVNGCDTLRWRYRLNEHSIYRVGVTETGDVIAFKPNGSATEPFEYQTGDRPAGRDDTD